MFRGPSPDRLCSAHVQLNSDPGPSQGDHSQRIGPPGNTQTMLTYWDSHGQGGAPWENEQRHNMLIVMLIVQEQQPGLDP